ncbi:type VI secretion protein IcmF [Burkholderiales bacterium JOSHI_001]|nr:type VI secretion protein IcmF [Burkholderiales bacterium JOSHI_001]
MTSPWPSAEPAPPAAPVAAPWRGRLQLAANAGGAAVLAWLAAPLLQWNGRHPLDGTGARLLALLGLAALVLGGLAVWQRWRQRRDAQLFAGLQDAQASGELNERFAHAARLLRTGIAEGRHPPRWWQLRRQIYQLPWYVIIGAPGAGKTTALLRSGLRFPLAERLGAAPVAGVGGTRNCDWWFTDQAVFIDTAGRYTTQDSDSSGDAREWQHFMRLLLRHRPVQPINGVLVTVSVPDLLRGGSELALQAAAVDRRLQELRDQLDMSFPVYLLVTKIDLLAGFVEFFGDANPEQREQAWGLTFPYPPAAGGALPDDLLDRLAELPELLVALVPKRLQDEPLAENRTAIFHFPAQVEALLPHLAGFARQALAHAADRPPQFVRGVHLTSGTQEGNPIDRVLGALSRTYGTELHDAAQRRNGGKAFFLATLLRGLVIAEAPLAGGNLARLRNKRLWLQGGLGLTAAAVLLALGGWWFSLQRNLAYVAAVRERVDTVLHKVDPGQAQRVDQLLPLYATLRQLAVTGDVDPAAPAWGTDFGLFQGPRLARSAEQTYRRVLDQTLAPLLTQRLNQVLQQEADPVARYDALRVAAMLSLPGRLDRAEVRRWATQAFAKAGGLQALGSGELAEWQQHLDALLDRNAMQASLRLDDAVLKRARSALAAVPLDQRVHERLLRQAADVLPPAALTLTDLAGAGAVLAFTPPDSAAGPLMLAPVYTRAAWQAQIEPRVAATAQALAAEAAWVLGSAPAEGAGLTAAPLAAASVDQLAQQVGTRHAQAMAAQWDRLLGRLSLQLPADTEGFARSAAQLGAAASPLRQLMQRLLQEFSPPATVASAAGRAFEAQLAQQHGALRTYLRERGLPLLDSTLAPLPAALREPAGGTAATVLRDLRAEGPRAPAPLGGMWTSLAEHLALAQRRAQDQQVASGLAELAGSCRRLTAQRFPFAPQALRDMPHADFARLFGPGGQFDTVFRAHLASRVDTRSRPWRLLADDAASAKLRGAVHTFELAQDIRRLFFSTGSELPQLRLQITPQSMDAELLQFSIDVDGQMLRYENGPRRTRALQWPGPAASGKVLMRILPPSPANVNARLDEGPWALLRVLLARRWKAAEGGALVPLEVDGRTLTVRLSADGPVNVNLLAELANFRCPEAP